ncbi:protein of unknown function [Halobiforma haloterrestris]|uniref:Uncharacterized protein n=1 Tax=Natronobacterium haloterrestre TaxID=148448 RepID=A0A1I1GDS8_NATHA|nr:nitroreductase/quinone reductase family protein [Halobiforma haloterrestris]SFC08018.1 protein of unknown function [Halobiforma haloterrestris]
MGAGRGNGTIEGDDESYVETRGLPVPEAAYTVINPLVELLLRSPLHPLVSYSVAVLTFTGAKTGNEYSTPVGDWVKDGRIIITTHSSWWRNPKGGAEVGLHLRGESRSGVATPYSEPDDVAEYMKEFIDRHGTDAARRFGIRINGDGEPTMGELEEGVTGTVVIEIKLTDDNPPVR